MKQEREILESKGEFHSSYYDTADTMPFLANEEYDELLSKNIVFLKLYDASANNTVLECIMRDTPLLVNPLPAIREYLGDDYPFYYHSFEEAVEKANDFDLIEKTHNYLRTSSIKAKLSVDYFRESFMNSEIIENAASWDHIWFERQ